MKESSFCKTNLNRVYNSFCCDSCGTKKDVDPVFVKIYGTEQYGFVFFHEELLCDDCWDIDENDNIFKLT